MQFNFPLVCGNPKSSAEIFLPTFTGIGCLSMRLAFAKILSACVFLANSLEYCDQNDRTGFRTARSHSGMRSKKRRRERRREICGSLKGTVLCPKAKLMWVADMDFLFRRDIPFPASARDRSIAYLADRIDRSIRLRMAEEGRHFCDWIIFHYCSWHGKSLRYNYCVRCRTI